MYAFNKLQQEDGTWCFEMNGIHLVFGSFFVRSGLHWMESPEQAIAFFNIEGNLYGLSNSTNTSRTAEAFYDVMFSQYAYFNEETFSERFFREYGFTQCNKSWQLEVRDHLGVKNHFEFRPGAGWYYNNRLLKRQPGNVGDLVHLHAQKTGAFLKRISFKNKQE